MVERVIAFSAFPIAGGDEPFRSGIREHAKRRTRALEARALVMLARGLSVPDKPADPGAVAELADQ